jgi:predicted DCC family thiol-disulfide oxidoreductase YuxK
MNESAQSVVLFDGECGLCSHSVDFIIRRDPLGKFVFAPLESEVGRRLLHEHGLDGEGLRTMVLVENGIAYCRSTAALRIIRRLGGLWPILYVLIILPRPIRDWAYDFIARNRHRWFRGSNECRVVTESERQRFLN